MDNNQSENKMTNKQPEKLTSVVLKHTKIKDMMKDKQPEKIVKKIMSKMDKMTKEMAYGGEPVFTLWEIEQVFLAGKSSAQLDELKWLESEKFQDMIIDGDYECNHVTPEIILKRIAELKSRISQLEKK